jgi:chemotaxis protein histidine kinase CheA
LYPSGASSIEGEAFEAWLGEAARTDPEQWPALLELAPTRVTLRRESGDVDLALEFIPVRDEGVVTRVMLLATDETEKQRLERAVREQEAEHQRQLNAMRRLLAGGGQLLVTTLAMGKTRLAQVAEVLERSELGPAEIDAMFRQVHTIQGEARAFDLGQLGNAARVFEDYLALLRSRLRTAVAPTDDDRRVLAGHLTATLAALEGAATLLVEASPIGPAIVEQVTVRRPDLERVLGLARDRRDELGEAIERLAARPFGEALLYLSEAVPSWAERYGRRVALEVEGRDAPIPPALARALPPALTHLARNAVVHGIEPATEREAAGKPATGRLRVRAESTPGGLEIRFSDDGRGLDRAAIEEKGRALGLRGRAEELVFVPGLSTRETELSGQGVGLDAVREELHGAGYQIELVDARRRDGEAGLEFRIFPHTNGSPSNNRSRVTA